MANAKTRLRKKHSAQKELINFLQNHVAKAEKMKADKFCGPTCKRINSSAIREFDDALHYAKKGDYKTSLQLTRVGLLKAETAHEEHYGQEDV